MNASLDYLKPSFRRQTILFPSIQIDFNGYIKRLAIEYFINGCPGGECMFPWNMMKTSIKVSIWKPTEDGVYTWTGNSHSPKVEKSTVNSNSSENITTAILNTTFHLTDQPCVSKNHILGFTLPGLLEDNLERNILVRYIPIVLMADPNSTILEYKKCLTGHGKTDQPCFPVIERGRKPNITITEFVRIEEGKCLGIACSVSWLALVTLQLVPGWLRATCM